MAIEMGPKDPVADCQNGSLASRRRRRGHRQGSVGAQVPVAPQQFERCLRYVDDIQLAYATVAVAGPPVDIYGLALLHRATEAIDIKSSCPSVGQSGLCIIGGNTRGRHTTLQGQSQM